MKLALISALMILSGYSAALANTSLEERGLFFGHISFAIFQTHFTPHRAIEVLYAFAREAGGAA